jgi:hypothetical protein
MCRYLEVSPKRDERPPVAYSKLHNPTRGADIVSFVRPVRRCVGLSSSPQFRQPILASRVKRQSVAEFRGR